MEEHRTPKVERRTSGAVSQVYDLEERLLNYAAEIIKFTEKLPQTRAGNHVAGQLLRSGTSPLSNHGEAEAAESHDDFVHKLKICLKELRESWRWIRLTRKSQLLSEPQILPLEKESDELIRIFVASIRTSKQRALDQSRRARPPG